MEWIGLLQWPAMAVTIIGSWFSGSRTAWRRQVGFWALLAGNALWMAWGSRNGAWALVALQLFLAAVNLRNVRVQGDEAAAEAAAR